MQRLDDTGLIFDILDVSPWRIALLYQLAITNTSDIALDFSIYDTLDGLVTFVDDATWAGTVSGDLLNTAGWLMLSFMKWCSGCAGRMRLILRTRGLRMLQHFEYGNHFLKQANLSL